MDRKAKIVLAAGAVVAGGTAAAYFLPPIGITVAEQSEPQNGWTSFYLAWRGPVLRRTFKLTVLKDDQPFYEVAVRQKEVWITLPDGKYNLMIS